MEDFVKDIFEYNFLSRALIATIFMSISCGIIGSYVVVKRMVFICGGITHASFGGIGLAYYFGVNPLLGAMAFSILSALGIETLVNRSSVREDSAIGVVWAIGMAIGIIFTSLTPGYLPNLMGFLFGNILTVNDYVLYLNIAITVILVLLFTAFYRKILYITFDKEYSKTQGVKVNFINMILMLLVSIMIVATIKLSGVVLLVSLLTIPTITALLFTKNFKNIILLSVLFSFIGSMMGLYISYITNIPCGATIVVVLSTIYLLIKLFFMFSKRVLMLS